MQSTHLGDISTFNMQHGYSEALLRGYRSGFLTETEYHHISQCETLEGCFPVSSLILRHEAEFARDRVRNIFVGRSMLVQTDYF